MKYYIIAGEASGDLHGSNLIKELKILDTAAVVRGWGGNKMEAAGATLVKHYRDLAFMGFVEVIKNLGTIFRNLSFCKQDILQFRPHILILVDYPGFNLRIANWAGQHNIRIIYYISPQVWAWKESRVKAIKRNIDKMLVILPFEKNFYKRWDYEVEYVGHPLVKVIDDFKNDHPVTSATFKGTAISKAISAGSKLVALLPGSRQQEILKKLPYMLAVTVHFPDVHFVVAKAPGIEDDFYNELLRPYSNVSTVINQTYEILAIASAALVTSGTATLETALFGVPEVVCYKGNAISYQIAKRLIRIKYISLVNLIMNKEVVKELIQNDLTVPNLKSELHAILYKEDKKEQLQQDYQSLKLLLSQGGNASANAAKIVYEYTKAVRTD